jgi:hypothetical protein
MGASVLDGRRATVAQGGPASRHFGGLRASGARHTVLFGRAARDQEPPVKTRAVIAACVALMVAVPLAEGAGWKRVTAPDGTTIDQVGLLRTADGVLHLAWNDPTGNTEDLLHTVISPRGAIGATTPIQTGWAGVQNAALVPAPGGGIRAFWGGQRTVDTNEPNQDLNTALSVDGGATWALQIGTIAPPGAQAHGSPVSATALPDGTPLQAWAGTLGTWVHSGLDPATPNRDFQAPLGAYGYDAGIASDPAGQAVLAWYSNATGNLGVFAQNVAADGSPVGAAANFPGTGNMTVGMLGRTPIVARAGGGFYVAYPTGFPALNRIRLWRVGAPSSRVLARTSRLGSPAATLAAAADGRLWVAWIDAGVGSPRVLVRRSNAAATVFGAVVDAGRPARAASGYRLDASASGGALDVLGVFTIGAGPGASTYHARVLPGLTLLASRRRVKRDDPTSVTFTVLDAGDPVRGARIRAGGKSGLTNVKGKLTLSIPGGDSAVNARASAAGYTGAALRLRRAGR